MEINDGGCVEPVRFVAFLGTTRYKECDYYFDADDSSSFHTEYAPAAIVHFLMQRGHRIERIHIVCTEEARAMHFSNLSTAIQSRFHQAGAHAAIEYRAIPAGDSEDDLWRVFEILNESFALDTRDGRRGRLVVDITHGFRSQPFFAASVLAFTRLVGESSYPIGVYYGGSPKNPRDPTPEPVRIWDLTPFIEVIDWALALHLFLKTGRGEAFAELLDRYRKDFPANGQKGGIRRSLDRFRDAISRWSEDFQTLRVGDLLLRTGRNSSVATILDKAVTEVGPVVAERLPPIRNVLERVRSEFAVPLICDDNLTSESGRAALLGLAKLYLRMGRYIEAATIVREAVITQFARSERAWRPGPGYSDDERGKAERICLETLGKQFKNMVGQVRNDLDHAGFNDQPRKNVRQDVDDAVQWLAKFLQEPTGVLQMRSLGSQRTHGIFLNLSNHPLQDWTEEQKAAALAMGCEDILDVPFPAVPPDATTEQVRQLAKDTVRNVPETVTHAMVMGEFTLTFELVRALQERGVRCFVATTARDVDQRGHEKVVRFHFERFREYPELDC